MAQLVTLHDHLRSWSAGDALREAVAETVLKLTAGTGDIAALVRRGPLAGSLGAVRGGNADGDAQKELDVRADEILTECLADAPVAVIASEERDEPIANRDGAILVAAFDPLDGSSNIDTNVAVGTIFSLLPTRADVNGSAAAQVLQPGTRQVAAGYVIYGPQTALVLSVGAGTHIFTRDPDSGTFMLTQADVAIPQKTREFAINVSNFRHWDAHVRTYIDDCLDGETGPRGESFNMRWVASLVAECHRIFSRGGIFLYPADQRGGYARGRLRLTYEANPIAWLVEQAGGGASTGHGRILDIEPSSIHQRVPLIFGSKEEVDRVERYYTDLDFAGETSPLFAKRGLFRS